MDLSKYIKAGVKILASNTITIDGVDYKCVYNTVTNTDEKVAGGLLPEFMARVVIETSNLPANYQSLKGKKVILNGFECRVFQIEHGDIAVTLTVQSILKS